MGAAHEHGKATGTATGLCDSCGRNEELEDVRRIYVVPGDWDREESITRVDGVERWCFTCRSMYPHEPVG